MEKRLQWIWLGPSRRQSRQYFSYIVAEETGVPREKHRPAASHRQTLSHNVVPSTHRLGGIRTHNFSGDRH